MRVRVGVRVGVRVRLGSAQHQKKPGRSRPLVRLAMPLIRSTLPSATPQLSVGGLAMSANSTCSARGKMSNERECTARAVGCAVGCAAAAVAAAATSARPKRPEAAPQSTCVIGAGAASRPAWLGVGSGLGLGLGLGLG